MNIEKTLREYKENIGKIETIKERDKYWQYCLNTMTDEEIAIHFAEEKIDTFGMPKAKNKESTVEITVIKQEVTREMVKQWIKDDKSRLAILEYEVKQMDIALGSLTEEENYVIVCKCIDNWKWFQVEKSFNEKFRKEKEITTERLKQIKICALNKMKKIINT